MLTTSIIIPATAAAAQPPGGLSFTPVSPTRVFDSRTTGHKIAAHDTVAVAVPTSVVPDDATEVVLNLTGTDPDGPTWFRAGLTYSDTSNLNLDAGETRANLVTTGFANHTVYLTAGPNAADAVVDIAGYYSPTGGSRFKALAPQRILDTRDSAPLGPGGTTTVDLSGQVPDGATAAVFNLTGTDVTGTTFVTAYPSGQEKPDASNLNLVAGRDTPNLVTVKLGADRKVTLANAHSSVDLVADLAGYYAPQADLAFYPLEPFRAVDTRDASGNPRTPIGADGLHSTRLGDWLPAGAGAAVVNLTGTNVTGNTYLTAFPYQSTRSAASTLNLVPGQTSANSAVVALGTDDGVSIYNHSGQVDAILDVAGYFAAPLTPCQHNCVLNMGRNDFGTQGNGTTHALDLHTASTVYGLSEVTQVAAGEDNVYALKSDGTVWSWGANENVQLGNGRGGASNDTPNPVWFYSTVPVRVLNVSGVTQIAPGYALKNDGTVWSWGPNTKGRLGIGSSQPVAASAMPVSGLTGVTAIAGDDTNGYALKSDGTVWAWGENAHGQLGTDNGGFSSVPVQVGGLSGITKIGVHVAVKSDGTPYYWGPRGDGQIDFTTPATVPGLDHVVSIGQTVGEPLTNYAVKADGTVWAWGAGNAGQLGDGKPCISGPCYQDIAVQVSGLTGVTAVSGSYVAGFALKSDGTVWGWGTANVGEFNDGKDQSSSSTPMRMPGLSGVTGLGQLGNVITAQGM